jgi:hypothetical protein
MNISRGRKSLFIFHTELNRLCFLSIITLGVAIISLTSTPFPQYQRDGRFSQNQMIKRVDHGSS